MYCTKCGHKNEDDAVFCTECGQRLEVLEAQEKQNFRSRNNKKAAFCGLFIVLVAAVVTILWLCRGEKLDQKYLLAKQECYYRDELKFWTEKTYNLDGNVEKLYEYERGGTLSAVTTYEYDENKNLIRKFAGEDEEQPGLDYYYTYDDKGNKISETLLIYEYGEIVGREEYGFQYDSQGNLVNKVYEHYDEDSTITSSAEHIYEYDDNGNVVKDTCLSKRFSNGVVDWEMATEETYEYTFDTDGNVLQRLGYDYDGNLISSVNMTYDSAGNLLTTEETVGEGSWKSVNKEENEYDEDGNLIKTVVSSDVSALYASDSEEYTYLNTYDYFEVYK